MALIFCDGFDHYGSNGAFLLDGIWAQQGGVLVTNPVRTGTRALSLTGAINRFALPGDRSVVGLGFAVWFGTLPVSNSGNALGSFRDSLNTIHVEIVVQSTGRIAAWRGPAGNGTLIATTSGPVLTAGAWNHVEMRVAFDNLAGSIEVRVNGVTVLDIENVDTVDSANASCGQLAVTSTGNGSAVMIVDDFFIWDTTGPYNNDFLGDRRVQLLLPDADTPQTDWVRNTGSTDFGAINEVPPNDDATYVAASDAGFVSEYGFQDLPPDVGTVAGLVVLLRTRKTDAGDCNTQTAIRSPTGGSPPVAEAPGPAKPITTQWTYRWDVFEQDPATGAGWTRLGVNAATFKVTRTV